jgi:hypothetical protein
MVSAFPSQVDCRHYRDSNVVIQVCWDHFRLARHTGATRHTTDGEAQEWVPKQRGTTLLRARYEVDEECAPSLQDDARM